jgi:hypothetical protein
MRAVGGDRAAEDALVEATMEGLVEDDRGDVFDGKKSDMPFC